MAQGEFTKEEAKRVNEIVDDLFTNAIPKKRQMEYLGHLNDIMLFLATAEKAAPEKLS